MKLRLTTDLLSGLLFFVLGTAALFYAAQYPLGAINRMGAGYFPRLISIGLMVIGGILLARSLRADAETAVFEALRPLFFVLVATLSFGLLIESSGLLVAGGVLVVAARLASSDVRPVEVIVLALTLVAATAVLFSYLLGLSIPVLPRW